jgi:hypothetical protein
MLSPDKRKNPSEEDGVNEENESEMYSENKDTFTSSVPTTASKKRKRDLAWSIMEGLSGQDPFEGTMSIY